jgi:hypothetical protein
MKKQTTNKPRVKAKNQKLVSRAVKEAGFKNIKEAKEVMAKQKEQLNLENAATQANIELIIPEGIKYQFIKQEVENLKNEGAPFAYIAERVKYLVWKTRVAEVEAEKNKAQKCACGRNQCQASPENNYIEYAGAQGVEKATAAGFPINIGDAFIISNQEVDQSLIQEFKEIFGPIFKVLKV